MAFADPSMTPGTPILFELGNGRMVPGTVVGPDPKNTANLIVKANYDGKEWIVHWSNTRLPG